MFTSPQFQIEVSDKGLPETKAGLYHLFVKRFYTSKKNRFPTTQQQRQKLNAALGRLAKRAIDAETSRFRLRHEFVSNELGDPEQEDFLFCLALQLGWLNQVGFAAESDTEEQVYAFFHPTFQEYFTALAIDDWDFFLPPEHKDRPKTSPFKVTNEDTLFECYHLKSPTQILGFLNVEMTNLRSEFHHLERARPKTYALYK